MRTRHMPTLEAIRFGETMRLVAARTQDAAEGGAGLGGATAAALDRPLTLKRPHQPNPSRRRGNRPRRPS